MQKGFSVPMILIVLALVVSVSAISWVFYTNYLTVNTSTVKGAAVVNLATTKPGLGVTVTSKNGTWDLAQYVCKTLDECTGTLEGGKKYSTYGGGTVSGSLVVLPYSVDLDEYAYVKYFVKSSWGGMYRSFTVSSRGDVPDTQVLDFKQSGSTYTAVVSPLAPVRQMYVIGATITD